MQDDNRHDEMLMGLVYRARWDEQFRKNARENPQVALSAYSYHLTQEEMNEVLNFVAEVKDLSDEALSARLAAVADPISTDGA